MEYAGCRRLRAVAAFSVHAAFFAVWLAVVIALAISLFSPATAAAGEPDAAEVAVDHALTNEFVTPHTPWGKPYAKGSIRVLFFSDGAGTFARECVEVMQRFDIKGEAVFWAPAEVDGPDRGMHWHGGAIGERRMGDLLRKQWDCIVFLGQPPLELPPAQRELFVDAVNHGTGVVFVSAQDEQFLKRENRVPIPSWLSSCGEGLKTYHIGAGRGAWLHTHPKYGFQDGWEAEYDYWEEKFGRVVLWAAGHETSLRMALAVSPVTSYPGAGGDVEAGKPHKVSLTLSGSGTRDNLTVRVSLRKPGRPAILLPEQPVTVGTPLSLALPGLARGTWHVDARVTGPSGVETWGTIPYTVQADRSVTGITLSRRSCEPGGSIRGTVSLAGRFAKGDSVQVLLLDRRRRELMRQDIPAVSGTPFSFDIPDWLPMLVTVEARLYSGGAEIAENRTHFRVTKRNRNRFNFLIWGVPKGPLAPYAEESLVRQGVTVQLDWENPPPFVAGCDISWVPNTTNIPVEKGPDGIMKPFCWNDDRAVQKQIDTLVNIHRGSREHGTFVYSIGDENKTLGSCLSPYCADSYRTFLRESYGSLEALNRSWGTNFASWRTVGLSAPRDDDELAAKRDRNYPRWFDRQAYKSWNYVRYCQKYAAAYKKLDPDAKTGFDGAGGFASGDDLDLIIRSLDSWVPYQGLAEDVIRSIAPRDFIRSNWVGGRDKTAGPLLQKYWRLVNMGADSVWWWMWTCIGQLHGFLAPDLRPFPEIAEVVKDTQIVRDGLGDLLLHASMQDDGIGVLYSYPSQFAQTLEGGASLGGYEEAHAAVVRFIRSSGRQFRYITDRMVRRNEVDLSKYRVLFVPRTDAMGDAEAEAIRRFAEHGGTVVADFRPGMFDDHCKPRKNGALDSLFGVKPGSRKAQSIELKVDGAMVRGVADSGAHAGNARAGSRAGGMPLLMSRTVGKGRAILLNCTTNLLPALFPSVSSRTGLFGGEPAVRVSAKGANGPQDIEVTRWKDHGMDIVSVLAGKGNAGEVALTLPRAKYLYDLRGHGAYGPGTEFASIIIPNRASFFVMTDGPLPLPEIRAGATDVARGTSGRLTVALPGAVGTHAVKMTAEAGGKRLDWLDRTLLVGAEPVAVDVPVAFNDPAGSYRITFTDIFTNQPVHTEFSVVDAVSGGNGTPFSEASAAAARKETIR